jgi:hypothetical protein
MRRLMKAGALPLLILLSVASCRREASEDGKTEPPAATPPAMAGARPGLHDHTPHHGGVVAMAGMIHLEARATRDGRVQVWLTDLWRRPLALDGVTGTVTLQLPGERQRLDLTRGSEALEATGPALTVDELYARVEVRLPEQVADINFALPLAGSAGGAAGVPAEGCRPPELVRVLPAVAASPVSAPGSRAVESDRLPRCVLEFPKSASAMAATRDGATLLVAVVDFGVSAWRLPAGEFISGFAPAPPVELLVPEPPHPEAPNAIAPLGTDAVVALEGRLLRYDVANGRLLNALEPPGGVVRSVAASADHTRLLVTSFYSDAALLVSADRGQTLARLPVAKEGAAVAFSPGDRLLAAGSEAGPVMVYDGSSFAHLRELTGATAAAQAVAFAGPLLVSAHDDGTLRVWNYETGALVHTRNAGTPLMHLALAPDGRRFAVAGFDGRVRLYDLPGARLIETLPWHGRQIAALAWAGTTLVSGDTAGRVALWDLP